MLRFCGTIGTLTSRVWVRLAVRWAAGWPPGHFRYTLVKVSWGTLGSQQALLPTLKFVVLLHYCLGIGWLGDGWVSVLALAEFLAICVVYGSA